MKAFPMLILILLSQSFSSEFPVIVGEKVAKFIDSHKSNTTTAFRSGLLNKAMKTKAFSGSSIEGSVTVDCGYDIDNQVSTWRNGDLEEYSIKNSDQSDKWLSILRKRLAGRNFEVSFDSIKNEFHILPVAAAQGPLTQHLPVQQLLNIANDEFEKILPFFKKHAEYDFYAAAKKNDTLDNITACYRRIFKHGVVKSNASSVNIQIDAAGNLMQILFSWPSFVKIDSRETLSTVKISDDVISLLKPELERYDGLEKDGSSIPLIKAEINGITFGWYLADIDGMNKLTPCYTFSTNLYYGDGEKTDPIISIPIYKKYYPDQK
jgi:hypothetical protein